MDDIDRALEEGEQTATLEEAARFELELLWCELGYAMGNALNGRWSITCENLVQRIRMLTQHAGGTPWDHVGPDVLKSGVYQRLSARLGVDVPEDEIAAWLRELAARPTRF